MAFLKLWIVWPLLVSDAYDVGVAFYLGWFVLHLHQILNYSFLLCFDFFG